MTQYRRAKTPREVGWVEARNPSLKSRFSRQCHLEYQGKISASRQDIGEYDAMWRASEHIIFDSQIGGE